MKKISILYLVLIFSFLIMSKAFAAQLTFSVGGGVYYAPTTVVSVYTLIYNADSTVQRIYRYNKFDPTNNVSNYPYEIYLPNKANPGSYKIHSNYSKSTDACAACHSTHTAVGQSLLQWYTVYDACMACHDGTVSTTYNVMEGNFINGMGSVPTPTYGGAFGAAQEPSGSSHNVIGSVNISAAPGGTYVKNTSWDSPFTCSSCHTPHGEGGNARILSPNPNGINLPQAYIYTPDATVARLVYSETEKALFIINDNVFQDRIRLMQSYPSTIELYDDPTLRLEANDITTNYYVYSAGDIDYGSYTKIIPKPGIIPTPDISAIKQVYGVPVLKVRMNISNPLTAAENVNHVAGINTFCGACHTDYNADIYADGGVHFNSADVIMGKPNEKRPGYGTLFGTYSKAYRHAVGLKWNYGGAANTDYIGWNNKPMATMGRVAGANSTEIQNNENGLSGSGSENATYISCLTCHFAHGTSQSFWKIWLNKYGLYDVTETAKTSSKLWTQTQLREIAGSSALKRLPNMGTCEACHQKNQASEGGIYNSSLNPQALPEEVTTTTDGFFNYESAPYVGDERCASAAIGCHQHQEILSTYQGTAHGRIESKSNGTCDQCHKVDPYGPLDSGSKGSGCEACHKGAGNHIKFPSSKNILNPRYLTAARQNEVCYKCHSGDSSGPSVLGDVYSYHTGIYEWQLSKHNQTTVMSCSTCHDSHKLSREDKSLKAEYNSLCANCHLETFDLDTVMPPAPLADGDSNKKSRSHKFIPKIVTP